MKDSWSPSVGRSVAALLAMLVAFVALAAFFVAVDTASGVHVSMPLAATSPARTPPAQPPATPTEAARATPSVAEPQPTNGAIARATPPARTATPSPTVTPAPTTSVTATATAAPGMAVITATPGTATVLPTPEGGISPPRYGTLRDYANNTAFAPQFLQRLDETIITLVNQQRAAHGLAPLTERADLDVIAAARSQDLIKRAYFDHYDPTGRLDAHGQRPAAVQELLDRNNITYTEVGENLLRNVDYLLDTSTAQQAVQAWMNSKEHRDNILHPTYTTTGVGIAAEDSGGSLRVLITQVFLQ